VVCRPHRRRGPVLGSSSPVRLLGGRAELLHLLNGATRNPVAHALSFRSQGVGCAPLAEDSTPNRCSGSLRKRRYPHPVVGNIPAQGNRAGNSNPVIRERLEALGPAPRAELLHVLMLTRLRARRADRRVLELPAEPYIRELLIDCGGPDAPGGAHRDAAGGWAGTLGVIWQSGSEGQWAVRRWNWERRSETGQWAPRVHRLYPRVVR
jgi:hypothetical protein